MRTVRNFTAGMIENRALPRPGLASVTDKTSGHRDVAKFKRYLHQNRRPEKIELFDADF